MFSQPSKFPFLKIPSETNSHHCLHKPSKFPFLVFPYMASHITITTYLVPIPSVPTELENPAGPSYQLLPPFKKVFKQSRQKSRPLWWIQQTLRLSLDTIFTPLFHPFLTQLPWLSLLPPFPFLCLPFLCLITLMTIWQGHNSIGIVQVYRLPTLAVGNLQAVKGGSVVSLSSVEREGPAGGRCPQVYDQLPDG